MSKTLNLLCCAQVLLSSLTPIPASPWWEPENDFNYVFWDDVAPMPLARSDMTATLISESHFNDGQGARIYIMGGCSSNLDCSNIDYTTKRTCVCSQITNACSYFTPENEIWSEKCAPAPSVRHRHCAVAVGRHVWLLGGRDANNTIIQRVDIYDTLTDRWLNTQTLLWSSATSDCAAFAYRGKVFVVGGYSQNYESSAAMTMIDASSWEMETGGRLPSLDYGRGDIFGADMENKFYVIGGYHTEFGLCHPVSYVEVYDPEKNVWTSIMPLITGRANGVCGVMERSLLVFGGKSSTRECGVPESVSSVERYSENRGWEIVTDVFEGAFRFTGVSYESRHTHSIYLFGGAVYNEECDCYRVRKNTMLYTKEEVYYLSAASNIFSSNLMLQISVGIGCLIFYFIH